MVRRSIHLVGFIALGAAINIAVAWGWAAWGVPPHVDAPTWAMSHDDPPFWIFREYAGSGAALTLVRSEHRQGQHVDVMKRLASIYKEAGVSAYARRQFTTRPEQSQTWSYFAFDERGWPLRSMRSEHEYIAVSQPSPKMSGLKIRGGIQLWPEQTQRGGWALQRVRALPLQPIWPGFIANTLAYTIAAALVLLGFPAVLRAAGAKRCIRLLIAAIAIAPLLVIGVAWLAAWQGGRSLNQSGHRISGMNVERQDRSGATRLVFSTGKFQQFDFLAGPPIENVAPDWSARWRDSPGTLPNRQFEWLTVEGSGWPCRALSASFHTQVRPNLTIGVTVERGILLDPLPTGFEVGAAYNLRMLPTQPLWRGFAINWALYAFILFGILALPVALKRSVRRRRGRCLECGYDLRSDYQGGCPECGWRRGSAS